MTNLKILEILKEKNPNGDLIENLERIKQSATPLLAQIKDVFPEYTSHEISHKEQVLKNLEKILPEKLAREFNEYELYFLIASIYLHDIGMANLPELKNETIEELSDSNLPDYLRDQHHLRVQEFIKNHYSKLSIADHHQARIIGIICRGHRKSNLYDKSVFDYEETYSSFTINVPLLAGLLSLSDELDMTFERTPMIVYEKTSIKNPISKLEWERHLSISGVDLRPDDPLTLIAKASCKNHDIHRLLKSLESKINVALDELPYHLHHYRKFGKDIPRRIIINIDPDGYKPRDIKFTLQQKQIFELLMGNKLYETNEECVRELIKNSLDACNLRIHELKNSGLRYDPKIELTLSDRKLTIRDNGIGMDEDIIERFFTKIGISYYSSNELSKTNLEFTPVSELGIGVLSCFMLADRIQVETKMENSEGLFLEITDAADYFFVRDSDTIKVGTTITLFLKEDINEINLEQLVRQFARHIDIPIVTHDNSKTTEIIDSGFQVDESQFKPRFPKDEHKFLNIEFTEPEFEGLVSICGYGANNSEWIPFEPIKYYSRHYQEGREQDKRLFISNEGIFVTHESILPNYMNMEHVFCDINIKKHSIDLDVSREKIVHNKKFQNLLSKFQAKFEERILENLTNLKFRYPDKAKYYNQLRGFFSNYFRPIYSNETEEIKNFSETFKNILKEFYPVLRINETEILYTNYNELSIDKKPFIGLVGFEPKNFKQIVNLLKNTNNFSDDIIYLCSETSFNLYLKSIFEDITIKHYSEFIKFERLHDLDELIPKTWKLVKLCDHESDKFIVFAGSGETDLNINNEFVKLLIKAKDKLGGQQELTIRGFFQTLRRNSRLHFESFISDQKNILKIFVELDVISEYEVDTYLLTKDDFPFDYFERD